MHGPPRLANETPRISIGGLKESILGIAPAHCSSYETTTVIKFTWGSLPVDALNRQTMKELRVIANREGTTIEQVMSKALDWVLATPERSSRQYYN
jgi:hypothetical protein